MKSIFTLFISLLVVMTVMAQRPEGVFAKFTTSPTIDGVVDDVWSSATVYNIDKPYRLEVPTVGESGETTWQGGWVEGEGVYILLKVTDDAWYPSYMVPGSNNWEYDKPEIYFDVNYVLEDGGGASGGAGHIQIAPAAIEGKDDGTPTTDNQVVYSFKVDGSNYVAEYFIPFTRLLDKDGNQVDVTNPIGFDVTIIDRDPGDAGRRRMVWANVGGKDESWSNMDDAGHVTFEGAEPAVWVDAVTLNQGGTITTNNGTLQMVATLTPENATSKTVKWTVENGTGKALIDQNGLLTAVTDGTVTVKATAQDPGGASATADVVITGQVLSKNDVWNSLNLIRNWNFTTDLTGWGGWVDAAVPDQVAPKIEEGVAVMKVGLASDGANWHYQHNQNQLQGLANVPYVLYFKSWASADNVPAAVDFEDLSGNNYNRYGASSDPEAVGGRSEWHYTLNSTPAWYTFHVTFDQMVDNTDQKVQWMLSLSNETIYLDSVLLVTQDLFDQLATLPVSSKTLANSIDKVYPNPVGNGNSLFVELSAINSKVAIYNSVGQKLIEKTANGYKVEFDVSSLRQGLYFVKTSDGSIQKFIR
jgi:hypothetical protein